MTDSFPAQAAPAPALEPEVVPPSGVDLDYPSEGAVRVRVRIAMNSRLLLAVPRLLSFVAAMVLLAEAWRHHVLVFFWFFGLPFARWLRGPGQSSLLIGERALEIEGARLFGGALLLPRRAIKSFEIGRAGPLQLFQTALLAHTQDLQTIRLLVGLSPVQAEFVNGGLQRWLSGE
jgi:hypothetical protein